MVKLKICGLTRRVDYRRVCELGVDFAGFVFYPPSPRYVPPAEVGGIAGGYQGNRPGRVGVFVNEAIPRVREIYHRCRLDIVQLHGDESPGYCSQLNLPCWKVLRPGSHPGWQNGIREYPCQALLLDSYHPGLRGGTGIALDPGVLAEVLEKGETVVVAGGVSCRNLPAVCRLKPWGVDVSSSVESSPGIKDHRKLTRLAEKWRRIRREGIHGGR